MSGWPSGSKKARSDGVRVGGAIALCGGTAAAGDYPPRDTTVTTIHGRRRRGSRPGADPATSQLPATGSDSDTTLKLAGGAVVAGAGLLVAARLRRRPAAA